MGANRRRIIADGKGDGSCKLWVPDSFDAKAYVKPIHADKLNIFVAHIFAGHLRGQEYRNADSGVLRDVLGRYYRDHVLQPFMQHIGHRATNYEVGSHAFGYALDDRFNDASPVQVPIERRVTRERYLVSKARAKAKLEARLLPVHKQLRQDQHCLGVWDMAEAIRRCDAARAKTIAKQRAKGKERVGDYHRHRHIIDRVLRHDHSFTLGECGRVFGTVTGLASGVRDVLTLNGQRCVQFDLKCSQPALLGYIMQTMAAGEMLPTIDYTPRQTLQHDGQAMYAWMAHKGLADDVRAFIDVVTYRDGQDFYELLQGEAGYPEGKAGRDAVKVDVLKYIINWRGDYTNPIRDAFGQAFPTVTGFIQRCASQYGHRCLIRTLQHVEAIVVLHRAVPAYKQLSNGAPVLTLHDGVYVPQDNATEMWEALANTFSGMAYLPHVDRKNAWDASDDADSGTGLG